ncbi:MAG: hypothetical protein AABZ60_05200 [Planctomycetota bacterium]
MIVDLSPENIAEIAYLHQTILPKSPIPQLGQRFMLKFYYPNLLADAHSGGALFYFQQKPIGFISYTANAPRLFREWLWKKGFLLSKQMILTLIENPQSMLPIGAAILLISCHSKETQEPIESEILSFGVLPEYRSLAFYQKEKIKVANELFQYAKSRLKQFGVKRFKLATNQSRDYIAPNIFYQNQGMNLLESKTIRGFNANIYVGEL